MQLMQFVWIGNQIGDEGARMIGEGLKCNRALTELDLCGEAKREAKKR